jgi:hypothetical protein
MKREKCSTMMRQKEIQEQIEKEIGGKGKSERVRVEKGRKGERERKLCTTFEKPRWPFLLK